MMKWFEQTGRERPGIISSRVRPGTELGPVSVSFQAVGKREYGDDPPSGVRA